MAAVDVQSPVPDQQTEPATTPALPDYVTNPNAVLGDAKAVWRYGRAPDYSKTRKVWAESMSDLSLSHCLVRSLDVVSSCIAQRELNRVS